MSFGIPVRNGLGVGLLASTSLATRNAFSPAALFAAGEQGAWYDPSDLTTMFQDSAGTTPVTATGQAVGRILDKSGRGNHATQATAASRPIYGIEPFGGRRNLLTYTEQFDNAAWQKNTGGAASAPVVTANFGVSPDGTTNADRVQLALNGGTTSTDRSLLGQSATIITATAYTFSIWLRSLGGSVSMGIGLDGVAGNTPITVTSTWQRFTLSGTSGGTSSLAWLQLRGGQSPTQANAADILVWGAQLETGSTATAYQRVTDQWNVTQAGVPSVSYLAFDGTDDWLLTPTITPGTNAAQAFAGVRKLSDATTNVLLESSGVSTTNPGTIGIFAPSGAAANYNWRSQGSNTGISVSGITFAAPITNVVTGIGDIAADTCILRVNGAQVGSTATDQGAGNYLAYPIYIGRRNGTSFPLNGRIYSLIVRFGANLTAGQIGQTESWVNGKTGAY